LPEKQMIQKVKGRTFHLPLPLQETWNKLCKNRSNKYTSWNVYFS